VDGARSALIVAADQYTDPGLRRLRAPGSDARALAAVLRDPGIGDFEVRTLLNEPAHVVNLAVEEFFADRRPGDLLLVHFSGHGVKDEDGELYFAAANTVLGRLGATAVAAEFVSRRMNRSRSRRVVLLLDCCYAGAFERGLVARAGVGMGIEQQFGGRGRAVITASSAMEYAFEAGELADAREVPPSMFTSALVQGLATGDADRDQDGLVGLDELYEYVYDKVRAATPNQTPGKWAFGMEGELYIARRSRPVTTPAPLPPELVQAIDSPLAGVRAGAVHELERVLRGSHAGMALAARLALERLTDDDSRAVAAAAAAALGVPAPVPPAPPPPELALSATVIDLGRLPQHGRSPEHRVRISNAGGGDLNAQAAASASWLKLRQDGDELAVGVDTSAPGEYEGIVTVDSDGGRATIRVQAQVDPTPPRAFEAAADSHPGPVPETLAAARPGPRQDPALDTVPLAANAVPTVTKAAPSPTDSAAGEPDAGPDAGPAALPDDSEQRATPPPRDDHPRVAASGPGPGPGKKSPRAPRAHRLGRAIWRRPVIIAATALSIAVIGIVIVITTTPGGPTTSVRWTYTTGGAVFTPAVAGGTVYAGGGDAGDLKGKVYALDAATGHLRWTYTTGSAVVSAPAVAASTVYADSLDDKVYALDAATGHLRWTYTTGDSVGSSPAVAGSTVYAASNDHKVYALDAATGHVRWTYTTGDAVPGVVAAGSTVYAGSGDHKLYALDDGS
jgi:PQQ-like domain/Caspase domain